MTWEIVTHGGWRCLVVGLFAAAAVVATALPSTRSRAALLGKMSLGLSVILSLDMIASGLYQAFSVESPAGLAVVMVGATTGGFGPIIVGAAGLVVQSAVALVFQSPAKS